MGGDGGHLALRRRASRPDRPPPRMNAAAALKTPTPGEPGFTLTAGLLGFARVEAFGAGTCVYPVLVAAFGAAFGAGVFETGCAKGLTGGFETG